MGFYCRACKRTFPVRLGMQRHFRRAHRYRKPQAKASAFRFHEQLNGPLLSSSIPFCSSLTICITDLPTISARPCDRDGNFLPDGAIPEDDDEDPDNEDWESFSDRPSFEFCELHIEKMHTSVGDINWLLRIIQAKNNLGSGDDTIFANVDEMYAAVDGIDVEGAGWRSFRVRYVPNLYLLCSTSY